MIAILVGFVAFYVFFGALFPKITGEANEALTERIEGIRDEKEVNKAAEDVGRSDVARFKLSIVDAFDSAMDEYKNKTKCILDYSYA